ISVTSEALTNEARAPMNLTLALDESGSMAGKPIEMLRESCLAMAGELKLGDTVSVVTWDTDNATKLAGYAVEGPNDSMLVDIINNIVHGGGTDLNGGLVAGYGLANASYDPERINRLVLISDGGANVGVTDADLIAENAGNNNSDGIYMVGVGVGNGSDYNDKLMDTVTDLGKGASVFIPNKDEAQKIFGDSFVNTMAVAARDVRVQLDLPPGFEIVTFSGEEFGTDPSEIEPQHIAPNDSMVFHQRITTCAPELIDDGVPQIGVKVTYADAKTFEEDSIEQWQSFSDLLAAPSPMLLKGAAIFAYAEAAKATKSGDEAAAKLEEAVAALAAAKEALPNDVELDEISNLIGVLSM
ncbi:MAG: vWA domain-containing protein, partial [Nannocystaceae bacterium]